MKYCCECQVDELHKRKCDTDGKRLIYCEKEQRLRDLKKDRNNGR